jgi:hypothetical protein
LDKHDWVKQELHTKFWLENLIEWNQLEDWHRWENNITFHKFN